MGEVYWQEKSEGILITIMKHNHEKSTFLEALRESPVVARAAKKAGISKATIYRWMKDIPEFRRAVNSAIKEGNAHTGEMVEMILVKKAMEGNFNAMKFYLTNNNPKYAPKRTIDPPPLFVHKHDDDSEPCQLCIRVEIEKRVKNKVMAREINQEIERLANPKTEADRKEAKEFMDKVLERSREQKRKEREDQGIT